jgi:hypothetical protein
MTAWIERECGCAIAFLTSFESALREVFIWQPEL